MKTCRYCGEIKGVWIWDALICDKSPDGKHHRRRWWQKKDGWYQSFWIVFWTVVVLAVVGGFAFLLTCLAPLAHAQVRLQADYQPSNSEIISRYPAPTGLKATIVPAAMLNGYLEIHTIEAPPDCTEFLGLGVQAVNAVILNCVPTPSYQTGDTIKYNRGWRIVSRNKEYICYKAIICRINQRVNEPVRSK